MKLLPGSLLQTGRLLSPNEGQGPRSTDKERNEDDDEGESEPLRNIAGAARGGACGGGCGHGGGGDRLGLWPRSCIWGDPSAPPMVLADPECPSPRRQGKTHRSLSHTSMQVICSCRRRRR